MPACIATREKLMKKFGGKQASKVFEYLELLEIIVGELSQKNSRYEEEVIPNCGKQTFLLVNVEYVCHNMLADEQLPRRQQTRALGLIGSCLEHFSSSKILSKMFELASSFHKQYENADFKALLMQIEEFMGSKSKAASRARDHEAKAQDKARAREEAMPQVKVTTHN